MLLCRMIYNMCTQKPPNDYSEQLYTRYRDSFSLYINEKARALERFSDVAHSPAILAPRQ